MKLRKREIQFQISTDKTNDAARSSSTDWTCDHKRNWWLGVKNPPILSNGFENNQ